MPPTAAPPWVVRVGRVGGTEVRVSASCLVVVALIAVAFAPRADALVPGLGPGRHGSLLVGTAVGVLVYAAALVHEGAHALVARRHGHAVPSIALSAAGGRTQVAGASAGPREEATTAFAGPAVSLVIGLLALGTRVLVGDGVVALVLEAVVVANLLIGLVDLVPTPPLDGGRLVRALGWSVSGSRARGSLVAARTGRGTAVVLALVPVASASVTGTVPGVSVWAICLGLAAFAWAASTAELAYNRLWVRVEGHAVADLVRSLPPDADPATMPSLDHGASAEDVLPALVRRPAEDHVVLDESGAPRGVLSLGDLERASRR